MSVNLQVEFPDPIIQKIVINRGVAGEGVPIGGTTGQALIKATDDDYETEWVDIEEPLTYIGSKTLTSATSIAWDITDGNGRSANLTDLAHDATLTISNLTDGETVEIAVQQDSIGGRSLTLAHAGLTVVGITTAIAGLGVDEWGFATARRVGSTLIVEAYALPV